MPYTPINWQDGEAGGTPLSAANLNHMETQYEQAVADAGAYTDSQMATLAPIIAEMSAILASRIVDHNLDQVGLTTHFYIRYANGLQECFGTQIFPEPWATNFDQTMVITWAKPFTWIFSWHFDAIGNDATNGAVASPVSPSLITTENVTVRAYEISNTAGFNATSSTMVVSYRVLGLWAPEEV